MVHENFQAKWCHEFRCHQNTRARDRIDSFSQSAYGAVLKGSSSHYKAKQRWLRSYDNSKYDKLLKKISACCTVVDVFGSVEQEAHTKVVRFATQFLKLDIALTYQQARCFGHKIYLSVGARWWNFSSQWFAEVLAAARKLLPPNIEYIRLLSDEGTLVTGNGCRHWISW